MTVCCRDCQKSYRGDKKRTRYIYGVGATILVVIITILITGVAMLAKEGKDEGSNEASTLTVADSSSSSDTSGTVVSEESTRDSNTDPFSGNFE